MGGIVAIVGRPNVGKSTFFNELLQAERSLVDKSAGTTRDSISHKLDINKAEIILTDTAGIKRKSKLRLYQFVVHHLSVDLRSLKRLPSKLQ